MFANDMSLFSQANRQDIDAFTNYYWPHKNMNNSKNQELFYLEILLLIS